jgi:hypothetical protein
VFKHNWRPYVPIAGWVVVLPVITMLLWLQDGPPQQSAQDGPQNTYTQSLQSIRSAGAIENQARSQVACDEKCQAANREKNDLLAQQSMAESAHGMITVALWQVVIGGLALIGLGVTVYYTRNTATAALGVVAAQKANVISDMSAKRQLRAYVAIKNCQLIGDDIKVEVCNYGQTPAYVLHVNVEGLAQPPHFADFRLPRSSKPRLVRDLAPTAWINLRFPIPNGPRGHILIDKNAIFCWGRIAYRDAFGKWHRTRFRRVLEDIPPKGVADFAYHPQGNNST